MMMKKGIVDEWKGTQNRELVLFRGLDRLETTVEQQVVDDFKAAGQKERYVQQRCMGE